MKKLDKLGTDRFRRGDLVWINTEAGRKKGVVLYSELIRLRPSLFDVTVMLYPIRDNSEIVTKNENFLRLIHPAGQWNLEGTLPNPVIRPKRIKVVESWEIKDYLKLWNGETPPYPTEEEWSRCGGWIMPLDLKECPVLTAKQHRRMAFLKSGATWRKKEE